MSAQPIRFALSIAVPALNLSASWFARLGHNWARWLLVCSLGFLAALNASHLLVRIALINFLWLGLVAYYLFRPPAAAFFTGTATLVTPKMNNSFPKEHPAAPSFHNPMP